MASILGHTSHTMAHYGGLERAHKADEDVQDAAGIEEGATAIARPDCEL